MKLLFVILVIPFLLCFVFGYPDKRPVLTVEEVSSSEEEPEIHLDHPWSCGTDSFSLLISEGTIDKDCPEVKNQFNNCCVSHDSCYDAQSGRIFCDDTFCECLQTATIKNQLCHDDDAHVFCNLVRQLGEAAYNASGPQNAGEPNPLDALLSAGEELNQTSFEYYDYERSEKTVLTSHHHVLQRRNLPNFDEIISDPVVINLVKTP